MNVVVVVKARSALSEDLLIAMTIIIVSTSGTVFPFNFSLYAFYLRTLSISKCYFHTPTPWWLNGQQVVYLDTGRCNLIIYLFLYFIYNVLRKMDKTIAE
jgi:hypothetical protein